MLTWRLCTFLSITLTRQDITTGHNGCGAHELFLGYIFAICLLSPYTYTFLYFAKADVVCRFSFVRGVKRTFLFFSCLSLEINLYAKTRHDTKNWLYIFTGSSNSIRHFIHTYNFNEHLNENHNFFLLYFVLIFILNSPSSLWWSDCCSRSTCALQLYVICCILFCNF